MIANPLAPRVLLLSLAVALFAWPLAWAMLAVAQGVGVMLSGGGFIGLVLPVGDCPWAAVNQPTVSYPGGQAALWGYWLAPALVALLVALLLPTVVPTPDTWGWELFVFHFSTAAAVLGLGWAPGLSVGDGPVAGLHTFWKVSSLVSLAVAALLALVATMPAVVRLGGHLWTVPGGPKRSRRALLALLHGWVPFVAWLAMTMGLGWPLSEFSLIGVALALLGCVVAATALVPRAVVHPRRPVGALALAVAFGFGVLAAGALIWAGTPRAGRPLAILWGRPGMTNNLRQGWQVLHLRGQVPAVKPPASPAPGR